MNFLAQKRSNIFLRNDNTPSAPADKDLINFHYREIARLSGIGGWSVNFQKKKSYIDSEARRLLETPAEYRLSLRNAINFFADEHQEKLTDVFIECSEGNPFSTIVKMRNYKRKEFWAKIVGKPVFNQNREVIGVKGVFQDITEEKRKELELTRSLKMLESQSSKLNNFANIITHSLRSHASNLRMTLDLYKSSENEVEKQELCQGLSEISESICSTIEHLTEFDAIHRSRLHEKQETVKFEKVFDHVKSFLHQQSSEVQAEIFSDFSEVSKIKYIPSYMEDILYHLLSNALKYSHPERKPVIEIYTYSEGGQVCLMVKDNGLGIDLEKNGNRIFNIYQTFHTNKDAEGVGLFLIKNKIESLQGSITVKSEVDKGSTFTIRF